MSEDEPDLSLEQMAAEDTAANSTAAADTTPAEPTEPEATTEPVAEETTQEESASSRAVIDYYLSQGESWAAKYPDDTELLKAIPHLARKIGERDEDAAWAKRFTPEQRAKIESLLTQPQAAQTPASDDPEPPYQEGWEDIVRAGNPPRDIVDKLNNHRAWLGRQILKQVRNPSAAIEKIVEKMVNDRLKTLEEKTGEIKQSMVERERQTRVQGWMQQHGSELYTEKGDFTPLGREADKLLKTDENLIALAQINEIAAYNNAIVMAKSKVPAPKGTKPVPKSAIREPAIAAEANAPKTPEEIALEKIEQLSDEDLGGYEFAKILAEMNAASA